jgi:hypothetical protein
MGVALRAVRQPLLIVNGERDTQVPPRYRVLVYRRSRSLLTQSGNGTPNVIVASTGCAGRNAAAVCGDTAAFSAITEVERRAVTDAARRAGAADAQLRSLGK